MGLDHGLSANRPIPIEFYAGILGIPGVESLLVKDDPSGFYSPDINMEVCSWRKANHIHNWFVNKVQDGNDDCHTYWVPREYLQELLDIVLRVEVDHSLAKELLPTVDGFFFGGTEIDDWYFRSLQSTREALKRALALPEGWSFEYWSSW